MADGEGGVAGLTAAQSWQAINKKLSTWKKNWDGELTPDRCQQVYLCDWLQDKGLATFLRAKSRKKQREQLGLEITGNEYEKGNKWEVKLRWDLQIPEDWMVEEEEAAEEEEEEEKEE